MDSVGICRRTVVAGQSSVSLMWHAAGFPDGPLGTFSPTGSEGRDA